MPKVTPDKDLENVTSFTFNNETFYVKTKFKVGRFLKTLNESPVDAIEFVLVPESFEKFLDTEMDIKTDLPVFMDALSTAVSGEKMGN